MKTIIVEDEIMATKALERLCQKIPEITLVGSYDSAESAIELFNTESIDLVLLDIEMPGMSGLQLIDKLPYLPQIIFTTGSKEYAFEAYEYDITDFLKKPITFDRFQKAIEKAVEQEERKNAVQNASRAHEIYIKTDGRFVRLPFNEIHYFENVGDYVKVVATSGNYVIHGSLKSIDQRISNPRFLKVHRSYIVNLDCIKDIQDNTLVIAKKVIPISRAHRPILMNSLNIL